MLYNSFYINFWKKQKYKNEISGRQGLGVETASDWLQRDVRELFEGDGAVLYLDYGVVYSSTYIR